MAESAKSGAEKAASMTKDVAGDLTERGKHAADQATQATRELGDKADELGRHGLQVVERTASAVGEAQREISRRSLNGTVEFGEAFMDLLSQQTQDNLDTMSALSRAADWQQVVQIQSAHLRSSMERLGQLTQRYLEIGQAVASSATSVIADKAQKAA